MQSEEIKYNKDGRITNIKCCPYCGELRHYTSANDPYTCGKVDKSFKGKDLIPWEDYATKVAQEAFEDGRRYETANSAFVQNNLNLPPGVAIDNFANDINKRLKYYPEKDEQKENESN